MIFSDFFYIVVYVEVSKNSKKRFLYMKLEQKTRQFMKQFHMLPEGTGVVIGLSGGADSVALLEVLCSLREELNLRLAAVHVHHGIREEAQKDADFCEELCIKKNVRFFCEYVDVPNMSEEQGLSLEEAGRNARYQIFEQYRQQLQMDVIAVAHHQNDQAETMLFQLFRGSGLRGMTGIPVKRGHIIRPLLGVSRGEIERYLQKKGLGYVTDMTNICNDYSRNKIRHHILPVAEEISCGAVTHMSHTAGQLKEILDFMEQQAALFLNVNSQWSDGALVISVRELQQVHVALRKMIVIEAIANAFQSRKDITEKHIESVLELLGKEGEKNIHLPDGCTVIKSYDRLIFKQNAEREEGNSLEPLQVEPNQTYFLGNGTILETKLVSCNNLENIPENDCIKWFDYDKINGALFLRNRKKGDYITIRDDGARKTLQDYLVNEKVPKGERDRLLVLADGNHIVWVLGKRISAHYKVTAHTKKILEVHIGGQNRG